MIPTKSICEQPSFGTMSFPGNTRTQTELKSGRIIRAKITGELLKNCKIVNI